MRQFVDADTGVPENPQIAYFDGYHVGDRLLEGVLFEVTLDEQGNFVCKGVRAADQDYYDDFSAKKQKQWQDDIVEACEKYADQLQSEDGRDIEVRDERGNLTQTPPKRIPVNAHAYTIDEVMADMTASKEFSDLLGLTVPQAEKRVKNRGIESIRPQFVDGEPQIGTADYDTSRLNVSVEGGKITAITGVG
jgi:hypothetical protein